MDLIQNYSVSVQDALYMAIKALEQETVTEFADRCRECGARYGSYEAGRRDKGLMDIADHLREVDDGK